MKVGSFDMGIHNFAFCIERYDDPSSLGEFILLENIDICFGKKRPTVEYIIEQCTNTLDKFFLEFSDCDYILIENQMTKNRKAQLLQHHCYSYFFIKLRNSKTKIINFSSRKKTNMLDAPKGMDARERKKWSANTVLQMFNDRVGEKYDIFREMKKKDDIADCVLQIQAFKKSNK